MSAGSWLWKNGDMMIAFGQTVNYEEIAEFYPDAEPVKPRFVGKNEKVVMPPGFAADFKTVMEYYGENPDDIERVWKPYVRQFPNDTARKMSALAADIRRRIEHGINDRIRTSIKESRDETTLRDG